MKECWIIETPDRPGDKGRLRSDILLALRLYGGRIYSAEERIAHLEGEKLIPPMYCEAREQKKVRPYIEKEIAAEIGQFLLGQGLIKFTDSLDQYGTRVRGTIAVFLEEAQT